jgi:hypothetical protein
VSASSEVVPAGGLDPALPGVVGELEEDLGMVVHGLLSFG